MTDATTNDLIHVPDNYGFALRYKRDPDSAANTTVYVDEARHAWDLETVYGILDDLVDDKIKIGLGFDLSKTFITWLHDKGYVKTWNADDVKTVRLGPTGAPMGHVDYVVTMTDDAEKASVLKDLHMAVKQLRDNLEKHPADNRYVAVIRKEATRDTQYNQGLPHENAGDEAWEDVPDAEIYVGVFEGYDEYVAKYNAAETAHTEPANIRLIAV